MTRIKRVERLDLLLADVEDDRSALYPGDDGVLYSVSIAVKRWRDHLHCPLADAQYLRQESSQYRVDVN